MMTEEEAEKKWCFQLASSGLTGGGPFGPHNHHCIGSACMAWRWDRTEYAAYKETQEQFEQRRNGYCGLAGKP